MRGGFRVCVCVCDVRPEFEFACRCLCRWDINKNQDAKANAGIAHCSSLMLLSPFPVFDFPGWDRQAASGYQDVGFGGFPG